MCDNGVLVGGRWMIRSDHPWILQRGGFCALVLQHGILCAISHANLPFASFGRGTVFIEFWRRNEDCALAETVPVFCFAGSSCFDSAAACSSVTYHGSCARMSISSEVGPPKVCCGHVAGMLFWNAGLLPKLSFLQLDSLLFCHLPVHSGICTIHSGMLYGDVGQLV